MEKTLRELAEIVGGEVLGDPQLIIRGVGGIKEAQPGEITFIGNPKYISLLPHSKASAVIISDQVKQPDIASIRTANPYLAFAKVLNLFYSKPYVPTGIHERAWVDPSASLAEDVTVQAFAVIGKDVGIGKNVQIHSGAYIGDFCQIGEETIIYPNVTVYHHCCIGCHVIIHAGSVIGSDGFGYVWDGHEHYKIPQVGRVVIEDNVEIGSGTSIDRGTIEDTVIRQGTKIDNLVQVAHNVIIGESSIIVSQVGIAGSSEVGKRVTLGGQVGVAGHITIGDNSMAAAKAGISKSIPPGSVVAGAIARPIREWRKSEVHIRRLPELFEEIKRLRKEVKRLEEKLS